MHAVTSLPHVRISPGIRNVCRGSAERRHIDTAKRDRQAKALAVGCCFALGLSWCRVLYLLLLPMLSLGTQGLIGAAISAPNPTAVPPAFGHLQTDCCRVLGHVRGLFLFLACCLLSSVEAAPWPVPPFLASFPGFRSATAFFPDPGRHTSTRTADS